MALEPELERYVRLCNASIDKFDKTDDLATKLYEQRLLEKNLKELLRISPGNRAALQVKQMLPEMRRKIEAKLVGAHKTDPLSDKDYFGSALEKLLLDVDGDKDAIRANADMLIKAATTGDWHQGRALMATLIPEYSWRWPAYEDQIQRRKKEKHLDYIGKLRAEPYDLLLERVKLSELREIARGRVKAKSKKDIIAALKTDLPDQEFQSVCTAIRQRIISEAEGFQLGYEYRCLMFIRRLASLANGMRSVASLRNASASVPGMQAEFRVGDPVNSPQECHARNGLIVSPDDPIVETMCPCERLECNCIWTPWNESWSARAGLYTEQELQQMKARDRLLIDQK